MPILDFLKRPPPTSAEVRAQLEKLQSELPGFDEAIIATFDVNEGPEFSAAILNQEVQERRIRVLEKLLPEVEAKERRAKAQAAADAENERRRIELEKLEGKGKQRRELFREIELFERNVRAVKAGQRDITRLAAEAGIPLSSGEYAHWSCEAYLDAAFGRTVVETDRFGWEKRERKGGDLGDRSLLKAAEHQLAQRIEQLKSQPPATADDALLDMEWKEGFNAELLSPLPEWEQPVARVPKLAAFDFRADDKAFREAERERLHVKKLKDSWQPDGDLSVDKKRARAAEKAAAAKPVEAPTAPIAPDHHEAAESETPHSAPTPAEISATPEELPPQGTDNPSYKEELQHHIGELKRLGIEVEEDASAR